MPVYEYKCPDPLCGYTTISTERGNRLYTPCPRCSYPQLHRKFSFSQKPMMHEHFNNAVGEPVSDMRQFKEKLKRRSEEAFLNTGMDHDFKPVEWGDAAAVGATNEGIYESNVKRSKMGVELLPEIPGV